MQFKNPHRPRPLPPSDRNLRGVRKNRQAKENKTIAKKKAEAKEDISKIGAIVRDGLNANPPLTYEEILKNVLKHHPESKFNKKHLSWYKNRLGLNKP